MSRQMGACKPLYAPQPLSRQTLRACVRKPLAWPSARVLRLNCTPWRHAACGGTCRRVVARALRAIRPLGLPDTYRDNPVITIGGSGGAVGAALRREGACVIQVQNPRLSPARFDLVIANHHDRLRGPNVVLTRTALHGVTPALLAQARQEWRPRLAHLPRPLVSVLVGGGNGRFRLGPAEGAALAGELAAMMQRDHVGIALTPSRRTDPAVCHELQRAFAGPDAWVWDQTGPNPYLGLLACADAIVVTMDSVSMVSEAVATSVPVMVAALPGRSRRIGHFA